VLVLPVTDRSGVIGDRRTYMDDVLLDIVLRRLAETPLAEQPTNTARRDQPT
jgi:hypothetical protein